MARKSRADSTEALLDVIREDGEQQLNFRDSRAPASTGAALRSRPRKSKSKPRSTGRRARLFNVARSAVVGVDIGLERVTVVKMTESQPRRLLDIQTANLDSGTGIDAPELPEVLRQLMRRVSGSSALIWVLYRAADVDIGTVQVPRLTGGKLSNAVYWQLQKERKFSDEEFILDYRVQRQFKDGEIPKTEVLTCLARRKDVERLKSILGSAGFRPAGATVIPAAFQNIYRTGWAPSGDGLTASLHVGATFSCITIYDGPDIRFSRSIKFGLDSMAEELAESYNQVHIPGASEIDSGHMDVATGRHVILGKLLDQPLDRASPGAELSAAQVFEAVSDSLERVARQAERTLGYYAQNYQQRCERLHLSGRIFGSKLVADYISGELSLEMSIFDPLGQLELPGSAAFSSLSERMGMNEAVATALSDPEQSINLIHNYLARQRDVIKTRVSNVASLLVIFLAMGMAGLFIWGKERVKDLQSEATSLQSRLVQEQVVDETTLARSVAEVQARQSRLRAISQRYEGLAVLAELERLTPEKVRLLKLSMELARTEPAEAGGAKPANAARPAESQVRLVVVEAIILGDKANFETDLTRYLIGLKSSQLFGDVVVQESTVQDFTPEGEVFHVILHLQLA
ncbi:type IV pilus biogenesis protein PilM [Paucidesulfovibrio longus]|uniref:pilus assembly protein PilM n=1 Tax=Paucidesulfovibrio longus TaxID=889 RepID=UPI0003B578AF|nr:pilus assembly protein PilM [Paucidesulfovibrio longus]